MNDDNLDDTKPLNSLDDLREKRSDKYNEDVVMSRSEKYKDEIETLDDVESLDNIETLSSEEVKENEILEDSTNAEIVTETETLTNDVKSPVSIENPNTGKKESFVTKMVNKWNKLDKKKKILFIILGIVILIAIVSLIVFLLLNSGKKPEPKPEKPKEEEKAPVIVDNYFYKDGNLHILKTDETEIGKYECKNKDDKLCYVAYNNNRDNFDVTRYVNENGKDKLQRLDVYNDDYVFIYDSENEQTQEIVLYSLKEEKEIEHYKSVKAFSDGYVIVENLDGLYGLLRINEKMETLIKPSFRYLGMIDKTNKLIGQNKNGYYVVSGKGDLLSAKFDSKMEIKNYNDHFIIVLVDGEYSAYDYKGNLIANSYDFILPYDRYLGLVKNDVLTIKDINNVKYIENGYKLLNSNYVKTYQYNSDGKVENELKCFNLSKKGDTLEVTLYDEDNKTVKDINLLEGLANKKYDYVNYFDGTLYFYKDAKKNDLIGSYTCSNKNKVAGEDSQYTDCFIAYDTVREDNDMTSSEMINRKSYSPIINNKFVFIQDGKTDVNLYNILDNKNMVTYLEINSMTPNDSKVTSYIGTKEVIVKTNKDLYGVIKFPGSSVSNLHKFQYVTLEKLGDSYLGKDEAGHYRVLYRQSESVGFPYKVYGYNRNQAFFKLVKNNKKYVVFDNAGNEVSKEEYDYVELYDDYFAGVLNGELNVYDYKGKKLSNKALKVPNYPFSRVANPCFKVRYDKVTKKYIASIYDGKGYKDFSLNEDVKPDEPLKPEPDKPLKPDEGKTDDDKSKPKDEGKNNK